jgi:hypothetical protein
MKWISSPSQGGQARRTMLDIGTPCLAGQAGITFQFQDDTGDNKKLYSLKIGHWKFIGNWKLEIN